MPPHLSMSTKALQNVNVPKFLGVSTQFTAYYNLLFLIWRNEWMGKMSNGNFTHHSCSLPTHPLPPPDSLSLSTYTGNLLKASNQHIYMCYQQLLWDLRTYICFLTNMLNLRLSTTLNFIENIKFDFLFVCMHIEFFSLRVLCYCCLHLDLEMSSTHITSE